MHFNPVDLSYPNQGSVMMLANSRYLGPACLPLIRWLLAGLAVVSGSGLRSVTAQPPTSSPPSATEVQQATVAILGPPPAAAGAQLGRLLYAEHCAGCHGEQGDGLAVAARYLLPRPRDLRAGKFRLVSTQNYVPSRQDLHDVLLRGMPGSSMPPWEHLSVAERDALIDEIYRLRAAGARDFYLTTLREIEGLSDEELAEEEVQEEIADYVARSTTAG
ncbi:MAG: cytochrome c, partial [Planctomycetales bacterium]|nr:cytochrome c [Planctomycetales bacterium]